MAIKGGMDGTQFGRELGRSALDSKRLRMVQKWYHTATHQSPLYQEYGRHFMGLWTKEGPDIMKGLEDPNEDQEILEGKMIDLLQTTRAVYNNTGMEQEEMATWLALLGIYGKLGRKYKPRLAAALSSVVGEHGLRGVEEPLIGLIRYGNLEFSKVLMDTYPFIAVVTKACTRQKEYEADIEKTLETVPVDDLVNLQHLDQVEERQNNTTEKLEDMLQNVAARMRGSFSKSRAYKPLSHNSTDTLERKAKELVEDPWTTALYGYIDTILHASHVSSDVAMRLLRDAGSRLGRVLGDGDTLGTGIVYMGLRNQWIEKLKGGKSIQDEELLLQLKGTSPAMISYALHEAISPYVNTPEDKALLAVSKMAARHRYKGNVNGEEIDEVASMVRAERAMGGKVDWDFMLGLLLPGHLRTIMDATTKPQ